MITTTEVSRKTGLSIRTLKRWSDQGIIPHALINTHPNGRGKVGYWPDYVLDRCQKLQRLRKEGHDIASAAAMLQLDQLDERLKVLDKPSLADVFANKSVRVGENREVAVLDILLFMIGADVKASIVDRDFHAKIIQGLKQDGLIRLALDFIQAGYNPFLTFDGQEVRIEPDFLLGHQSGPSGQASLFVLPLRPVFRKFLDAIGGGSHYKSPTVTPAPKVWVKEGDVMMEYTLYLGGILGFELIRHTGAVVGTTPLDSGNDTSEETHPRP